jgi:glycosyltransferase involved in cell wall biosynthesis
VAALNYRPNYGGIDWFVRRVWPEVRKRQPTASYHIVGRGLPKPLADKWSAVPGVMLRGFVDNLEDEYAACDFAIAPVFEGAGTKIKVLESLAHGRTCVMTTHAWRGYEQSLHNGDEVFVADEPQQMTQFCDGLLSAPARCQESGVKGRNIVDRDYSRCRFDSIVGKSVETVLSTPPGSGEV